MYRQRHVIKVYPHVHPRSDSPKLAEVVPIEISDHFMEL